MPNQSAYEQQGGEVYDLVYTLGRGKDYPAEARKVHEIIEAHLRSTGRTLLDVACGTGLHDEHLTKWYDVTGVDLTPRCSPIARRRLPQVTFHEGSMVDFDLGEQFDAVTCLFSAIGHVLTLREMRQAVATMAAHVRRGGVLLLEPWLHPDQYRPGTISTDVVRTDDIDIARMVMSERTGERISRLRMHHLVGRRGKGVEHFVEDADVAMYTAWTPSGRLGSTSRTTPRASSVAGSSSAPSRSSELLSRIPGAPASLMRGGGFGMWLSSLYKHNMPKAAYRRPLGR
jgi:SAM-dependent methyltransferase